MHTECFWHAYRTEMKLWCQKWRLLLRKTYDPRRVLLGDFLHILATLSQPEEIPWSTSSLIRRSGFFCGYLFCDAWRGQSHKIGETLPWFTNSIAFMVMGMAYFCIDGAFSLKIGNSQPFVIVWYHLVAECCISFYDLMRILEPRFFR